ncbi:aldehyde ferredoxin oxidoreductase family protein [Natranaeroarchaeum sulfidigenes]|uniref:Aldehyde:ferredoxin oxidoreductase n=1 Tax=Natranaeroarchaeum sulfidigenes TaxID=2784880 RepID=A0A897MRC6_9EURY|nr:Aldehyde:ferredoxin oxidoreductase [Natranaeroarchaeum sulfidigenes]
MIVSAPDRLLRVDLTTRTTTSERVPEPWLRKYIGGKGLGARYLYEELEPGTDPLGPENALLFMLGPLTGLVPGDARYAAVTKSPLTGTFLDSYAGGEFPAVLAGALDEHIGLLIEGAASEPVRIDVEAGKASVASTDNWGTDTVETAKGYDGSVACIGPAGENRVAYATIASDAGEHHAGRGGAGAVMGAKRLKAVVARGDPPSGLETLRERYERRFETDSATSWHRTSGTVETIEFADAVGALAGEGWQTRGVEDAGALGIEAIRERATDRERPNEASPGDFRVETESGEHVPRGGTAISLGAGLGIDEFDAVVELGARCDELGLDLIDAGSAVAWTIHASERGIVDRKIEFGDPDGARELLEEIVLRETPLGDALADGVDAAAEGFGGDELVPTVKAMALPGYDPRGAPSMALAYATSDRGACHRRALPIEREVFAADWTPERVAREVAVEQDRRSVLWSLVIDEFVAPVFDDLGAEWLEAVGVAPDTDLRTVGERIWTLTRLFNVREGFGRTDDVLPQPLAGQEGVDRDSFEAMLDHYYEYRGWGASGQPTPALVDRLEMSDIDQTDRLSDSLDTDE